MLRFLEHGCREGIRAGVSRQRLGPVFKAIADLRRQFLPLDFEAKGIRRGLSKARDDYAQRQLAVEIVLTVLGNIEYGKRISIMNGLRREWMDEREPEVKYALATIMIECEQRQRLSDADLQLKFRVSHWNPTLSTNWETKWVLFGFGSDGEAVVLKYFKNTFSSARFDMPRYASRHAPAANEDKSSTSY